MSFKQYSAIEKKTLQFSPTEFNHSWFSGDSIMNQFNELLSLCREYHWASSALQLKLDIAPSEGKTFEPSEDNFTCPRRRDGTIDRRYKSKCADKIAQEEREIAELYDGDRNAYVKSLKEEKINFILLEKMSPKWKKKFKDTLDLSNEDNVAEISAWKKVFKTIIDRDKGEGGWLAAGLEMVNKAKDAIKKGADYIPLGNAALSAVGQAARLSDALGNFYLTVATIGLPLPNYMDPGEANITDVLLTIHVMKDILTCLQQMDSEKASKIFGEDGEGDVDRLAKIIEIAEKQLKIERQKIKK